MSSQVHGRPKVRTRMGEEGGRQMVALSGHIEGEGQPHADALYWVGLEALYSEGQNCS